MIFHGSRCTRDHVFTSIFSVFHVSRFRKKAIHVSRLDPFQTHISMSYIRHRFWYIYMYHTPSSWWKSTRRRHPWISQDGYVYMIRYITMYLAGKSKSFTSFQLAVNNCILTSVICNLESCRFDISGYGGALSLLVNWQFLHKTCFNRNERFFRQHCFNRRAYCQRVFAIKNWW
jgi:hypothetical protein